MERSKPTFPRAPNDIDVWFQVQYPNYTPILDALCYLPLSSLLDENGEGCRPDILQFLASQAGNAVRASQEIPSHLVPALLDQIQQGLLEINLEGHIGNLNLTRAAHSFEREIAIHDELRLTATFEPVPGEVVAARTSTDVHQEGGVNDDLVLQQSAPVPHPTTPAFSLVSNETIGSAPSSTQDTPTLFGTAPSSTQSTSTLSVYSETVIRTERVHRPMSPLSLGPPALTSSPAMPAREAEETLLISSPPYASDPNMIEFSRLFGGEPDSTSGTTSNKINLRPRMGRD